MHAASQIYPRDAISRPMAMIQSGIADMTRYQIEEFVLADMSDAIAHAAATSGPFNRTALRF